MNRLEIKLKQHTPLIHFQHDQEGATLRASEVKPKLDRFVLTRLGQGNYQAGINQAKTNGWLIGRGDHPALDYKMRIEAVKVEKWCINEPQAYTKKHEENGKDFVQLGNKRYLARMVKGRQIISLNPYPLFFANMDADYCNPYEYRKFSFTDAPLVMKLTIADNALYRYLLDADLLNDFFFQSNFGTRQSKGFGSFTIDKNDPLYKSRQSKYRFVLGDVELQDTQTINDEYQKVFEYIDLFYKTLRGGINLKNKRRETLFYFKSLAYQYADEVLDAKWDKRKIKEEFYDIERQSRQHTYDVKDMLGFSTNEMWLSYNKDSIVKTSATWDEREQRFREPRGQEKPLAERMSSPILFKPIFDDDKSTYTVNLIFQDERVNMQGFKDSRKVYISSNKRHRSFGIEIPQEFSTDSFFDFIFNKLDIDIASYVDEEYHDHEYFDMLKDIYSQIKSNL